MAVSLATSGGTEWPGRLDHRGHRRRSMFNVSTDLIRSLAHPKYNKRPLSARSYSQGDDKEKRRTMPIRELQSIPSDTSLTRLPTAQAPRHVSYVLNSDSHVAATQTPAHQTRNVYVHGQKMVVKQGAKPIGSIKSRSKLSVQRARITDLAAILALVGLILAIIDAELLAKNVIEEGHWASIVLRSVIILTTCLLLVLVVWYHFVEVKILLVDCSTHDYWVVITFSRLAQCCMELCICSICPIPVTFLTPYARLIDDNDTEIVYVPLSGILTTAMFLRFYLLCRLTAFHSRQYQDPGTRTVAAMSRISIDFAFVMKTLMVQYPLTVLLVIWVSFALSIAWLFAQCERQGGTEEQMPGYLNSMWFMMATLMANGYGDTIPQTYCGRALAIITSLAGIGITASLVAVVREKLQLTQSERRVNEFVNDSRFTKEKKNAAAAVLQHTWKIHKCMNDEKVDDRKLRSHQRRFINAINEFRKVKVGQRMLFDSSYDLSEITHIQKGLKQLMVDLQTRHHQTARLALFAGQQMEQLRKAVEEWQAIRSQQCEYSNHEESISDAVTVSTGVPSSQSGTSRTVSTTAPVQLGTIPTGDHLQTGAVSVGDRLQTGAVPVVKGQERRVGWVTPRDTIDSHVVNGELADIAYESAPVGHEHIEL